MPNLKSAKKRLRQTKVRTERNKVTRGAARTALRRVQEAVSTGQVEQAQQAMVTAQQKLDKAGRKRVFHPNKAARLKSRAQRKLNAARRAQPAPASS